MAEQIPAFVRPGAIVEWDTRSGTAIAKVAFVDDFHVTLISQDGVTESLDASAFSTLPERVKHLRPSSRQFTDTRPGYVPSMWD